MNTQPAHATPPQPPVRPSRLPGPAPEDVVVALAGRSSVIAESLREEARRLIRRAEQLEALSETCKWAATVVEQQSEQAG